MERYPELFELQEEHEPAKRWGLCVGDGWYLITDAVLQMAQWRVRQGKGAITLTECKEKCGTLRLRFRGAVDERLRGAADAALEFSARTCELCGRPVENRRGTTRCCSCAENETAREPS